MLCVYECGLVSVVMCVLSSVWCVYLCGEVVFSESWRQRRACVLIEAGHVAYQLLNQDNFAVK